MVEKPHYTQELKTKEGVIYIAVVGIDDESYKKIVDEMQPRAGYAFVKLENIEQVDNCSFGIPEVVLVPDTLDITSLPKNGTEVLTVTNDLVTNTGDNRLSLSDSIKQMVGERTVTYFQDSVDIITETALAKRRKILLSKYAEDLDAILNTDAGIDTVKLLELFASKDEVALNHIKMVAKFASIMTLGMELSDEVNGLTDQERDDFEAIAFVHDIGKLITPDQLLKNEDSFSNKELSEMKHHVDISLALAKSEKTQELLGLALKHHYRFDGKGYSTQENIGEDIPIIPRMLAVIDAFEAISDSARKYQNNNDNESLIAKAINILYTNSQEKSDEFPFGGQFDPKVAHAFLLGFQQRFSTDEKFRLEIINRDLKTNDPHSVEERQSLIESCLETTINRFGFGQTKS